MGVYKETRIPILFSIQTYLHRYIIHSLSLDIPSRYDYKSSKCISYALPLNHQKAAKS